MMHTAACHIRIPAYRQSMNTAAPIRSAADIVTVKVITSSHCRFLVWFPARLSVAVAAGHLAAQPARPQVAFLAYTAHVGRKCAAGARMAIPASVQLVSHAHHLLLWLVSFP
jgi:hypothetical protein